jgi:thermostable 8-oxoguanine DNA glycosylase
LNELEARLIYAIIVAGKSADFADQVCYTLWDMMSEDMGEGVGPLDAIANWDREDLLADKLCEARVGNYQKNTRCLRELAQADIDFRTCLPQELEAIYGIGPKTSRFFILWTRPGVRYACLDVHILQWLQDQGVNAPTRTPRGRRYYELEEVFLKMADERGLTPRQLDYKIWCEGAGRTQEGAGYVN